MSNHSIARGDCVSDFYGNYLGEVVGTDNDLISVLRYGYVTLHAATDSDLIVVPDPDLNKGRGKVCKNIQVSNGGYYHDSTAPSSAQELGLDDKDFEFW